MSNITNSPKRLGRWFLVNLCHRGGVCGLAGRWLDPWLWAYIAALAGVGPLCRALTSTTTSRRNVSIPPEPGADRSAAAGDPAHRARARHRRRASTGRWQITRCPTACGSLGLVGMALVAARCSSAR